MPKKAGKMKPVAFRTDLYLVLAGRKTTPHRPRQEKRAKQKLRQLLAGD